MVHDRANMIGSAAVALALACCGTAGEAQEASAAAAPVPLASSEGRVTAYQPNFFREFRPNSAFDMITRIPGFTYNRGNAGVRGLAGSGGNVLIDGQRPASKSLNLDDVIRRIPVEAVARIDVITGGAPGLDMQGQTIVANIIRVGGSRKAAAAELLTKIYDDHEPARGARLEGSLGTGALSLEGSLNWREEKEQGNTGIGRLIRRDGFGTLREAGRFEADWDRAFFQATGAAEYRTGDNLFQLSLSGQQERQDRLDRGDLVTASGSAFTELVATDDLSREGEISFGYERAFGGGLDARFLVLESRELDEVASSSVGRGGAQLSTERAVAGESIARAAATYAASQKLTLEARVEKAFNFLESDSSLTRDGVPVPIPSASVRVEERRIDAGASARVNAWQGATFEAGLGFESSTIRQSGDVDRSKSLSFLKPRLSASIEPAAGWQVRLRAERIVGQLNFEDFASRASLDTGTINAGNSELEPEKSWLLEAVVERPFWERGALTLTFTHAWLEDVIDLVPIDGRFDAPGNIGTGRRDEAIMSLVLPLDRFSVPGGLIRLKGTWRWSEVQDPVTFEPRRISYQRPFSGELLVSKDLPVMRSTIGVDLYAGFEERSFRISEIRTESASTDPLVRAYWDWNPNSRTSLRMQVENFAFRRRARDRIFYSGPRRLKLISGREYRSAMLEPFLMFRLRRSF